MAAELGMDTQPHQRVVVTDLDATLLNHHDYSMEEARPAIQALLAADIPLILNSSKSFAEMLWWQQQLGLATPFICENGAALVLPPAIAERYQSLCSPEYGITRLQGHMVWRFAPSRAELQQRLSGLRCPPTVDWQAFSELNTSQLSSILGLDTDAAALANERLCSDPLLWRGTSQGLQQFELQLQAQGMLLTQGGRCLHALVDVDKGQALAMLLQLEAQRLHCLPAQLNTLALGDSSNDLPMLKMASQAVVVPHADGPKINLQQLPQASVAPFPGAKGWCAAVMTWLNSDV